MTGSSQPIEGFAIETVDGLIFTVKGVLHSPERLIAYLRYAPDPGGERCRDGRRYRRLYHFEEQVRYLSEHYQDYQIHEPVLGLKVQCVPRCRISRIYDPVGRLSDIFQHGATDCLEEQALRLATVLLDAAQVPKENLGITGSLLTGLHLVDSDLDLVVYGESASKGVYEALGRLMDCLYGSVRRPDSDELKAIHARHRSDTPIPFEEFAWLQSRKVNEGRFNGKEFFVRFVRRPEEIGERYADRIFKQQHAATIESQVADDQFAIYTPCRYNLQKVSFLEGCAVERLTEIVSFRGRFSDQARKGERVIASGVVEHVQSHTGAENHRLVVGGAKGDFIRLTNQ